MRILLVEDEEKVSRLISRGLAAEQYAIDTAFDGRRGLELAVTYQYDLIILDLMLPVMSGTEVLRQLRRINQHVPILILTARDALSDKVEHFEAGTDKYHALREEITRNPDHTYISPYRAWTSMPGRIKIMC